MSENEQKPFDKFVKHQRTAFDEAGKALLSLIPKGFREHGQRAVEEMAEGIVVVADAIGDELKKGFSRGESGESEEKPTRKVEVDVE